MPAKITLSADPRCTVNSGNEQMMQQNEFQVPSSTLSL
jgi:hypothetical protein